MAELKFDFEKMMKGFIKTAEEKGMFVGYWTPASNPPKQDGKYLVTTHSFNHDKIEVLGYANNLYEIDNYNFWNMERAGWYDYDDEYGYFEIDEVVAWCELPEPYKESEEV